MCVKKRRCLKRKCENKHARVIVIWTMLIGTNYNLIQCHSVVIDISTSLEPYNNELNTSTTGVFISCNQTEHTQLSNIQVRLKFCANLNRLHKICINRGCL